MLTDYAHRRTERHQTERFAKNRYPACLISRIHRCSDRPQRLAWPSYERCLEEAVHRGRKRSSGVLAAEYFEELMGREEGPVHLAVSGGLSVLEAVNAIAEKSMPNLFIHVTALVGYGILDKKRQSLDTFLKCGHPVAKDREASQQSFFLRHGSAFAD
jgi:hypothetical protein